MENPRPCKKHIPWWAALLSIAGLLIVGVIFWGDAIGWGPGRDDIAGLLPQYYDPATVRKVRKEMASGGVPCQSCHDGQEQLQGNPKEKGVFHDGIELKHGRNQHCFNCHHRLQPANFSNFDGAPIVLANVELLCARCHGTTYRDWGQGAHGRRSGYWDETQGSPKSTACIACHDPHWPIFKSIEAAPAPHVNPRTRHAESKSIHQKGEQQ